jgi:hypothetical protein
MFGEPDPFQITLEDVYPFTEGEEVAVSGAWASDVWRGDELYPGEHAFLDFLQAGLSADAPASVVAPPLVPTPTVIEVASAGAAPTADVDVDVDGLSQLLRSHPYFTEVLAPYVAHKFGSPPLEPVAASSAPSSRPPTFASAPVAPAVVLEPYSPYVPGAWTYKPPIGNFYRDPPPVIACRWRGCGAVFTRADARSLPAYMAAVDAHTHAHVAHDARVLPGRRARCEWAGCARAHPPAQLARHVVLAHTRTDAVRCGACHRAFSCNQRCNVAPARHGPRQCRTDAASVRANLAMWPRERGVREASEGKCEDAR